MSTELGGAGATTAGAAVSVEVLVLLSNKREKEVLLVLFAKVAIAEITKNNAIENANKSLDNFDFIMV
jgi:hypothetical protein